MIISLEFAPAPSTVQGYAEDAIRNMQRIYGVTLDYSIRSLGQIDSVLSEWHDKEAPVEAVTKSLFAFGSYAGEVMLQQEAGRWIEPPRESYGEIDTLFMFVRLNDGREWRPIAIAFLAIMNGSGYSLLQSAEQVQLS
jgi:hypothetical protein